MCRRGRREGSTRRPPLPTSATGRTGVGSYLTQRTTTGRFKGVAQILQQVYLTLQYASLTIWMPPEGLQLLASRGPKMGYPPHFEPKVHRFGEPTGTAIDGSWNAVAGPMLVINGGWKPFDDAQTWSREDRVGVVKIDIAARLRATRQYQDLDLTEARIGHAILASPLCYRPDSRAWSNSIVTRSHISYSLAYLRL